ncbi:thioredoxin family protein [Candidatus Formimonas warabiya]|uniref:Thioredoxin n=1 Tax=Formimonas warabiya TaxID=1761012 RepID=A0A3G1KTZ4_FORW1|nr:thioredoxin family protein [Candidatus Formimonas warabiya]ATW25921.1 thioredoxin [Candidatus Formimonas warabiya]
MKKLFLVIFIVGICLSLGAYLWQTQASKTLQAPDITPDQLEKMMADGEDFYVYFYSPTCQDCLKSESKLAQAVKKLSITNMKKLDVKKYESVREELQIPGTPSIFVYQKGKLVKGITGAFDTTDEYEKFFLETGGA